MAMLFLSLLPQIHLWLVRGRDWNGAYVSSQADEPLYSAYTNALINGRSRKNDPFDGSDSTAGAPLPESTFSTQFLPAYAIALPARLFGISASMSFILLVAASASLASLSIFWLLYHVTGDYRFSGVGTLTVLCFGCVVGRHGIFGTFLDIYPAAFPFLRRYQPAAAFPLFFVFQLLVWRALTTERKRDALVPAVIAGLTLVILIFSYLYLWTASAAWLACVLALWFCLRRSDLWKTSAVLTIVGAMAAIALVPYAYLVSHRAATLDQQQIMISTHTPDFLRIHELLAAAIMVALIVGILRKRIERTDPKVIYVASLALLPLVVFNQQLVTGRTMQPFHFEIFVVNYSTLIGLMITVSLFWRPLGRRWLIWLAGLSFAWAVLVVALPARLVFVPQAIAIDRTIPVILRLKELSKQDGTHADLRTKDQTATLVFSPKVALIASLPTWTSQGTLLDITGVDCRGVTPEERKRLLYMHLYYSRVDAESLSKALQGTLEKSRDELASIQTAVFGYERTSPALTPQLKPIQPDEIEREVQAYQAFVNSFSRDEALTRQITYAVIGVESNFDFSNLDRWYERDQGERVGDYILYHLKLRN